MKLRLLVIFETNTADEVYLSFQPVHMLFLRLQDVAQQVPGDVVAHCLAMRHGRAQIAACTSRSETQAASSMR